ncbi:hypothetical protein BJ322DRAFT_32996 [Thelephora terrestris]|uniref:Sugar phosphate transporter domain-containing protein n=1 Tax=Thelephora terrestris TaxID=56493 RepID=A0A9P6HPZ7_9AGAM|nr:hypothetical protein BJ322DRAFT_32996 [Thelephora terrestris]
MGFSSSSFLTFTTRRGMSAHSKFYVPFLIAGMIFTGSCNSLWSKYQDLQCVEDCDTDHPVFYEQPVWQTLQMFAGEMLCLLPIFYNFFRSFPKSPSPESQDDHSTHKLEPLVGWRCTLLWLPALCDLTGTTLMNIGLLYTPVSIYQMTRGSLVLFVGVLSVFFLRRHLWLYQWFSLFTVIVGVSLVGYSGSLVKDATENDLMTFLNPNTPGTAQSTKFVVEEKIMEKYSITPLYAVGLEGFFGATTIVIFMPVIATWASRSTFFDLPRGWHQMVENPTVLWSGVIIALSIAFFNFFGLSVTRHVSASSRSLTDTCRTLSIWLISLGLGWETFVFPVSLLQVTGFGLLVYGTLLFNDIVAPLPFLLRDDPPLSAFSLPETDPESRALLHDDALDDTARLPADLGQSGFDVLPDRERR